MGESLILNGNKEKGIRFIKEGWISAELSKTDLRFYRKKFKKYLNADDYIKRAEYLAWNNKYWDLKRLLRYLPKNYELLYTARQLLMSKSYGVDNAISKVPPNTGYLISGDVFIIGQNFLTSSVFKYTASIPLSLLA